MSRSRFAFFATIALLLPVFSLRAASHAASEDPNETRIAIVGDSTACIYPKELPYRGWGQFLPYYFKDSVHIFNEARPGRSTKTYMIEGSWKGVLKDKPKFIIIQFGTNDSLDARKKVNNLPVGVDSEVSYRMFLQRYVDGALKISAIPILVSPAHPRVFGPNGKLIDVLGNYVETMKEVAAARGIAMVDLYTASGELWEKLGEQACTQFEPVRNDRIHFNALGAKAMAELVMRRLPKVEPRIADYLGPAPTLLGNE